MAKPNDYAAIMISSQGLLIVIDGRGNPHGWDPNKVQPDPITGKIPEHPVTVAGGFIRGDHLYIWDQNNTFWGLRPDGSWRKGSTLGDGVNTDDPDPWVDGMNMIGPAPLEEAAPTGKAEAA